MKLYRTTKGIFVENDGRFFAVNTSDWDGLIANPGIHAKIRACCNGKGAETVDAASVLSPVASQDVWAAGVTYYRSRAARMEESKDAGGGTFYDRVYSAKRPELFFKSAGWRVVGPAKALRIRSDAKWSVPEPELTLAINAASEIIGYTIGNDMSSRDIEGENPLYLPQAKVYDGSCALGPCILLSEEPMSKSTVIEIEIARQGTTKFRGSTTLAELKRDPKELVEYLFRENNFPHGAFLMTGTGIVPADDFTLEHGDIVRITIEGIGVLENPIA